MHNMCNRASDFSFLFFFVLKSSSWILYFYICIYKFITLMSHSLMTDDREPDVILVNKIWMVNLRMSFADNTVNKRGQQCCLKF